MAKANTPEQEMQNVQPENTMEQMMKQLQEMQEQLNKRMIELDSREAALKANATSGEPAAAKKKAPAVAPPDPAWDEKVEIELELAPIGDEQNIQVGVNGRRYQIPRGKPVKVPLPLYERIRIAQKAERAAALYMRGLNKESYPGEAQITRL